MSEFSSYDDYQQELQNDRYPDDGYSDLEFRADDGYCPHGKYVGGCGADIMCDWCESGISVAEAKEIVTMERTRKVRENAEHAEKFLALLLSQHGTEVGGSLIAKLVENSVRTNNPLSRYGRH